ncbi:MAG: TauD/TfdA family dioxygenase [Methylococcaceae bacterium]
MKLSINFLNWQSQDIQDLDWRMINASVRKNGFCLIQHIQSQRKTLLELSYACGDIQLHERSDGEGIVEVSSIGDSKQNHNSSVFRGLSEGVFPPHTDGAYLNTYYLDAGILKEIAPPKLIILQCVRSAVDGGESILVDCQKILKDIQKQDRRLYEEILRPAALFYRGSNKSVNTPVFSQVHQGKYWIRFRDDVKVKISLQKSMAKLFDNYIQDSQYHVEFKLPDNAFVLVDNLRMLHMRRAFTPNLDESHRVLRRTWIYNDELDGDIPVGMIPLSKAFNDGTDYGRLPSPSTQNLSICLKTSLGIEL